jgi:hypothetical protein
MLLEYEYRVGFFSIWNGYINNEVIDSYLVVSQLYNEKYVRVQSCKKYIQPLSFYCWSNNWHTMIVLSKYANIREFGFLFKKKIFVGASPTAFPFKKNANIILFNIEGDVGTYAPAIRTFRPYMFSDSRLAYHIDVA